MSAWQSTNKQVMGPAWKLTYRIGNKTEHLVVSAYNYGHARRLFRKEWFSNDAPDYMENFQVMTKHGWASVKSMDQGLRRAYIVRLPCELLLWRLEFFKGNDVACLTVQAYSASDARRRMRNAWMTGDVYDHHFSMANTVHDEVPDYLVCISPNPWAQWPLVNNMEAVIDNSYIAVVPDTLMYFSAFVL
jgi:hypothetical protein